MLAETLQPTKPIAEKAPPVSVCIVAHKAYGALRGGQSGHIGGIEMQVSLLAKWLVRHGHTVSMLTWDEGGPAEEMIDGVRVTKICRPDAGLPGLRFLHPKWTALERALRSADADVYYQNGSECVTGQVAWWCARNRRPFVFSSASDGDCDARLQGLDAGWERALYRYGLSHAAALIVQTETQQTLLKKNFGVESQIIPMPCVHPFGAEPALQTGSPPKRVLWIGRVYQVKRPDRLLDIAERCPDFTFDLVGPIYPDPYSQAVGERAKNIKNVVVHGAVRPDTVAKFYRNASVLCCTSEFEGFPNTFLEAWGHGLPILSTFDPDSVIRKHGLGIVADNVDDLTVALRSLFESPKRYQQMSRNARQYVEKHSPESVLPQFEGVFQQVCPK